VSYLAVGGQRDVQVADCLVGKTTVGAGLLGEGQSATRLLGAVTNLSINQSTNQPITGDSWNQVSVGILARNVKNILVLYSIIKLIKIHTKLYTSVYDAF
jgi:hypothetical protein